MPMTGGPMDAVSLREYIESIFEEHRRAIVTAEQEREKAASAIRGGLAERILSGDKQLQAHIDAQIESVRLALVAQEKLSGQINVSAREAIVKAEEATNRRLDLLNEFRQQSADEQKSFARREVVDEKFAAIEKRLDVREGSELAAQQGRVDSGVTIAQVIGAITIVIAIAAILVGAFT